MSITMSPTDEAPTKNPTMNPTINPTKSPTLSPTRNPTQNPTMNPTISPTLSPTISPTLSPTFSPTLFPTPVPTDFFDRLQETVEDNVPFVSGIFGAVVVLCVFCCCFCCIRRKNKSENKAKANFFSIDDVESKPSDEGVPSGMPLPAESDQIIYRADKDTMGGTMKRWLEKKRLSLLSGRKTNMSVQSNNRELLPVREGEDSLESKDTMGFNRATGLEIDSKKFNRNSPEFKLQDGDFIPTVSEPRTIELSAETGAPSSPAKEAKINKKWFKTGGGSSFSIKSDDI